jgi:uncharacterized protein (DUF488 family)
MNLVKTIGHSNHPIERFLTLLKTRGVQRLVDVRSTPWSRRHPQFGQKNLSRSLAEAGIDYVHEGAALGGKPRSGASYDQLAMRPEFSAALDRVIDGARNSVLCLMCAEKEPLDCHRTVLVSRRLAERGVSVEHLLADGGVRSHHAVEEALLGKEAAPDFFEDRAARLARAWRRLEAKWHRAGEGE